MKKHWAVLAVLGLAWLGLSVPAKADPTPSSTVNMKYLGIPGNNNPGAFISNVASSSTLSVGYSTSYPTPTGYATFQGYANGGVTPSISLEGYATDSGISAESWTGSSGEVTMDYYYMVSSAAAFVPVTASLNCGDTRTEVGETLLQITGTVGIGGGLGGAWFQYYSNSATPVTGGSSMDGTGTLLGTHTASRTIMANTWFQIHMDLADTLIANTAYMSWGTQNAGTVTNSEYIDTAITIDPTWLAANPGDHVVFATLESVPEPASLVLLGSGLAALVGRRRRK